MGTEVKIELLAPNEYDNDERNFFSPSKIKKYRECKVCWAARYLDKIEQESTPDAARGSAIH